MMTKTGNAKPAVRAGFDSPQQEAYLSLWRTYDRLRAIDDEFFARFDLTAQQYNLLRLLRRDRPAMVPTLRLADQLISRAPDITRMVDKLEKRGLVRRQRDAGDRRTVRVGISGKGLRLLEAIALPLAEMHERQLGHLSQADLGRLIELLRRARLPHEQENGRWGEPTTSTRMEGKNAS